MSALKKAIIKSYDAAAHKATVQIAGSLGVWLESIRVATDIPAADVVAGRQCTVLFLDPSNQDDAVVVTIQGALPSGGGGGSSTFIGLTDTPASYAGAALQTLRVNAGAAAVEFHDPYAAAHTWAALQTFNAGVKLAAAQQIQDSGGTGRILLATASPHLTLTGDTKLDGKVGIGCDPQAGGPYLRIHPIATGNITGISIGAMTTFTGSSGYAMGLSGAPTVGIPGGTSGHTVYGLAYQAGAMPLGAAANILAALGIYVTNSFAILGDTFSSIITDAYATKLDPYSVMRLGGTIDFTNAGGIWIKGGDKSITGVTLPTVRQLYIEDVTGTSPGTVYLIETPHFRVAGKGNPPANQSHVYIKLGATLKQTTEGAADSGGAGYRALRVPN